MIQTFLNITLLLVKIAEPTSQPDQTKFACFFTNVSLMKSDE